MESVRSLAKRNKKKLMFVVLMPWSAIVAGSCVAVEAIAHFFGFHLGIGGF